MTNSHDATTVSHPAPLPWRLTSPRCPSAGAALPPSWGQLQSKEGMTCDQIIQCLCNRNTRCQGGRFLVESKVHHYEQKPIVYPDTEVA